MLPAPLPPHTSQTVKVSSLATALVKLNIDIPIEDLLQAIHEVEDEVRLNHDQRRAALSKLALQPTEKIPGLKFTTVSTFVPKPDKPSATNVDPLAKERRRRLIEMTDEAFPDEKSIPDPFIIA